MDRLTQGYLMDIRALTELDLELVCRHREDMFRDAGRSEDVLQTMTHHFRDWLQPRLCDGRYFWVCDVPQ